MVDVSRRGFLLGSVAAAVVAPAAAPTTERFAGWWLEPLESADHVVDAMNYTQIMSKSFTVTNMSKVFDEEKFVEAVYQVFAAPQAPLMLIPTRKGSEIIKAINKGRFPQQLKGYW